MTDRPTLQTERLILRPYVDSDAAGVQRIAGDRAIADTTLRIPHPYADGVAEVWIASHPESFASGYSAQFAMTSRDNGELVGGIGLQIEQEHLSGELGYYVAVSHWGRGLASEAAHAVVEYAFESRGLNRLQAHHMTRNPASGRVLEKLGMRHEGTLREHIMKWGVPEDVEIYAMLAADWWQLATSRAR